MTHRTIKLGAGLSKRVPAKFRSSFQLMGCALAAWVQAAEVGRSKWDKLPIDLLEVYFQKWELPLSMKVWGPCATLLLCAVGNDHQGVEPLS